MNICIFNSKYSNPRIHAPTRIQKPGVIRVHPAFGAVKRLPSTAFLPRRKASPLIGRLPAIWSCKSTSAPLLVTTAGMDSHLKTVPGSVWGIGVSSGKACALRIFRRSSPHKAKAPGSGENARICRSKVSADCCQSSAPASLRKRRVRVIPSCGWGRGWS